MHKNDIASFFYYMWNSWCKEECEIIYANSNCGAQHIWNKWIGYCERNGMFGAVEEFFANLDNTNQDLLVKRALEKYNRRTKIS